MVMGYGSTGLTNEAGVAFDVFYKWLPFVDTEMQYNTGKKRRNEQKHDVMKGHHITSAQTSYIQ